MTFKTVMIENTDVRLMSNETTHEGCVFLSDLCSLFSLNETNESVRLSGGMLGVTRVAVLINDEPIAVTLMPIKNVDKYLNNIDFEAMQFNNDDLSRINNLRGIISSVLSNHYIQLFERMPIDNHEPTVVDVVAGQATQTLLMQDFINIIEGSSNRMSSMYTVLVGAMQTLPNAIATALIDSQFVGPRRFFQNRPIPGMFNSPENLPYEQLRGYLLDIVKWKSERWAIDNRERFDPKAIWNTLYFHFLEQHGINAWLTADEFNAKYKVLNGKTIINALEKLGWLRVLANLAYALFGSGQFNIVPSEIIKEVRKSEGRIDITTVGEKAGTVIPYELKPERDNTNTVGKCRNGCLNNAGKIAKANVDKVKSGTDSGRLTDRLNTLKIAEKLVLSDGDY